MKWNGLYKLVCVCVYISVFASVFYTCCEVYFGGTLSMAKHPKLGQFHFAAHTNTTEAVAPKVPDIAHRVSDSRTAQHPTKLYI